MENVKVKPFLKWPGGKRRVLPEIKKYIPEQYGTYYEGFIGGGAVLLDLLPVNARVSDVNSELIQSYQTIRDNVTEIIEALEKHAANHSLEHFMAVRALDRNIEGFANIDAVTKTARMIYLNRTCFNGLYRVNSKNQFNSPFGKYENPKIVDRENLTALSAWLKSSNVEFSDQGYKNTISLAGNDDFVYLDPPYIPLTETASFVSYTKDGFDIDDQIALRDMAVEIDDRGGYVLLSNSDTPQIRELYQDFHIEAINVKRSVGASSATRKAVGEVLVLGKKLASEKGLLIA